jgi:glycosyltransferase involved in cell wall biosynthesis
LYGGLSAKLLGIPCVWYFHDLIERQRFAGSVGFAWQILSRLLSNRIVADSRAALAGLSSDHRGIVIHPGAEEVNEPQSPARIPLRRRLSLPINTILVGSLGRIAYVKGLDIFLEAAHMVVSQNQDIHFVIFGGTLFGEEDYKGALDREVNQFDLASHWHWMGYDEFAKEYLAELDFVVTPSRREAFGLAVVEAGLAGKAVIASAVGGIPEIIEDARTGVLVPPGDPPLLANAILDLAGRPDYARALGAQAKIRTGSMFVASRYIKDFLAFYNTLNRTV